MRHIFCKNAAIVGAISAMLVGCGDDPLPTVVPALVISAPNVTVAEGGTATFTVALSAPLTLDGAVTLTVANGSVATLNPQVVTFVAGDVAPKTITISGSQDNNLAGATTTVTIAAAGVNAGSIGVTVTDDDVQTLVLSTRSTSITEGGTSNFGVHLAFEPSEPVSVTLSSDDAARLGIAPTSLSFTSADYAVDQSVVLSALEDADVAVNTVVVSLASPALPPSAAPATVTATIADNDTLSISASVGAVALVEADAPTASTFTVVLTQMPSANVTISVASLDPSAATVTPATLTFTPADYATGSAHTVSVTPVSDNDFANESTSVTLTGGGLTTVSIPVTVTDDDVQSIIATPTTIAVNENATATATVRLAFDPGASTTVTIAPSDPGAATASPTTLTFDSSNYDTAQPITITGEQDDDLVDEVASLTLTSPGATMQSITVNVADDDTQKIQLTYPGAPGALTLPEGTTASASTQVVGVRLAFRPIATTTLTVASSNPNLTVSATTLTFTPLNFAVVQNVTLTALDENNAVDETAIVTIAGGTLSETINVNIPDTDVQGFKVTPGTLPSLPEGGSTTFTVALNLTPGATVPFTISSNNAKITVNGAATTSGSVPVANTAQTITLAAAQDADAANETGTLTIHDPAGVIADRLLAVTVIDDETMAFVLTPVTMDADGQRLDVTEQGANVTFTVALTAAPTANTTVTITPSATNVVEVSNNGTVFAATTTLTFTPGSFTARTITVKGLSDPNLVDETFNITVSGPGSLGAADARVFMRKIEDDAQSIITVPTAPGPLALAEGGAAVPMTVRLQFQPATTVQVTVTPSASTILLGGSTAPQVLLFTTTNYDQEQTLQVTTPQDNDQANPASGTITVSSPALLSRVLTVNMTDDDRQAIILGTTSTTLQEPPATPNTGSFTVRLAFVPTAANEAITIAVPGPLQSKVDVCDFPPLVPGGFCGTQVTLVFSNVTGAVGGWDQPQTVFLQAKSDIDVNNETVALALSSNRAPFATSTHTVNIVDDDALNVVIEPSQSATIEETLTTIGLSSNFTVRLNFDPTTPVTVALNSPDLGAVTVSPATLTFTSANFNTAQTFTVSSVVDADVRNELVNVAVTSARTPAASVAVTVIDHDQQAIRVLNSGLQINEGGNGTINLQLSHEPTANVVVAVSTTITAEDGLATQTVTASPSTVTFTPSNWNVNHAVTVATPEDADLDHFGGTVDFTVSSAQTGQELAADASATYSVRDNDSQGIVVTLSPAGVINSAQENGPSVEFKVHLAARPRLTLLDTLRMVAPPFVNFSNGNTTIDLQFDDTNFSVDQTVTWRVLDGSNAFTGNATLTVDETADQAAPFGAANISPSTTHSMRGIDNADIILNAFEFAGLNGATQFVQRANVAFGLDGTSEGIVAITGRSLPQGGNASLGFSSRTIAAVAAGPATATDGADPTTEIVEFDGDDDASGPDVAAWNTFTSDASGITYQRFSVTGAVLVAKTVVAPVASNATDFSVARNTATGAYGVIYRRETVSRNNLYFRTVTIASGAVSSEQTVTTADTFVHFHPSLMFVGDGNVTTFNAGGGDILAPYVVIYSSNGFTKLVRMTSVGGPLASFTFDSNFPGDFSTAIFNKSGFFGFFGIAAAAVHATGFGLGDHAAFVHIMNLTSSGVAVQYFGRVQVTESQLLPVSPPVISYNGNEFAVAFDDGLGGNNSIGVSLWGSNQTTELRLSSRADFGLFPSLAWALDRWILRYQANSSTDTGIRLRTGSFIGTLIGAGSGN
jgi:hypothetical protein